MENQKKEALTKEQVEFIGELSKIMSPYEISAFDPKVPTLESVNQMILANELKYIQHILDAAEENNLIEENAKDIRALDVEIQAAATKYALDIENTQDPDYFSKHNVSDQFIRPIQQIRTMIVKKKEAKDENWKAEYRARLVERLREIRRSVEAANPAPVKKGFLSSIFK